MVASSTNTSIHHRIKSSMRFSSVVPASVTDKSHEFHELTAVDLALKLHYIKGVYFFSRDAVEGLTIYDLKKPTFQLLQLYLPVAGRVRRRSETGRPYIKCNDSGVRIVEAKCEETVDEWLAVTLGDDDAFDVLAYSHALGHPDHLDFSPLVFLQFTWFKCGGMSVGISWANVLGDAFSASTFINLWSKLLSSPLPHKSLQSQLESANPNYKLPLSKLPNNQTPSFLQRVASVGDLWLTPTSSSMKTHTFFIHAEKINDFLADQNPKVSTFEVLSAVIWKILSKIKGNLEETRVGSLCRKNSNKRESKLPNNGMVWSTIEVGFPVAEATVSELVELIFNKREDENDIIEEMCSDESGEESFDFVAYGAKLTFVDLEEIEIYELELKGKKPVYANYCIKGVGDEGAVMVLPGPKEDNVVNGDRSVTVVLLENQLEKLKVELQKNWNIA